jgi:hypothetical protein
MIGTGNGDFARWAGRLWTHDHLRASEVVAADADFRRWHDARCTGCFFSTEGFVPGEHEGARP